MGFFEWLSRLFGGVGPSTPPGPETVDDIADRLDRAADRYGNSSDVEGERAARDAASRARKAKSVKQAQEIEREFHAAHLADAKRAKPKISRGASPTGTRYVAFSGRARVGGSRGWRNNNPGYIRCSDQAVYYGAIGCDGEFAIFPDMLIGRMAMNRWLADSYPDLPIQEALRRQIPEEAGQAAVERAIEESGLPPELRVRDLNEDQLRALGESMGAQMDREAGEQIMEGNTAPDWLGDAWDGPAAVEVVDNGTAEGPITDNS